MSTPIPVGRNRRIRTAGIRPCALYFLACGPGLAGPAAAQLTDLGAHLLIECSAPGNCLELDAFGSALAVGDFDNDSFADLAVGVPGETVGGDAGAGSVHVYYGSPGGLTSEGEQIFDQDSPGIAFASEPGDRFGGALAAGDFDRDGFDDLAIGIDGEDLEGGNDSGALVVLFGSSGGLDLAGNLEFTQGNLPPGTSADSSGSGDQFGFTLAAGPFGQLAIGLPFGLQVPGFSDEGLVHALTSSAPGSPLDAGETLDQDDTQTSCGNGGGFDFHWGFSLLYGRFASTRSLVVGIPGDGLGSTTSTRGRIAVFTGAEIECFDQNTTGVLDSGEIDDDFGHALAKGDFDDNGFDDLVISVPLEDLEASGVTNAGIVQTLPGSSAGFVLADQQLFDQNDFTDEVAQGADHFGKALAAGDFDGDGHDDLAIGVPDENVGSPAPDAGTVNVLYGQNQGLSVTGNQTFHSDFPAGMPDVPSTDDFLGASLAAGDFDGIGTADLAIGAPGEDIGLEADAGAVTVLYGLLDSIDAFGTVQFGSAITVSEATANRVVGISRAGGAVPAASVSHARSSGSATPGTDFTYTEGVESWNAGEIGVELFIVRILADTLDEGNETIHFELADPSDGIAVGSPATVTMTIEDDDEGGVIQFHLPGQSFAESAGTITVQVTRNGGAASGVTVQYATAGGSAVAGQDFVAQSGTLTFAAGDSFQSILIPLIDDTGDEPAESFTVVLSGATGGATLGGQVTTLIGISDNDPAGQIFRDGFESGDRSRWSSTTP